MTSKQISGLVYKDFLLEWRQKHALGGIALYLVSTIFICYLAFSGQMNAQTWNALFWIIMAFASLNLVLKSFAGESGSGKFYLYTLASPQAVIFSKIYINGIGMTLLGLSGYFIFSIFMGSPVENPWAFLAVLILGVWGFSSILTMVSAIAGQTKNAFTLMAILGFPLLLPLLLMLIKASAASLAGAALTEILPDLTVILGLIIISLTLSFLLFPYIWKE